ncbi:MAG: ATP synthase subunit I [Candidatus Aminicenantes bacterium]|nr:ATP synthase subunit I [Candidatus Aminicenantes bacterium]
MAKENNTRIIKRILRISMVSQIIIIGLIYVFTKSLIYCIITLLATIIGILSFLTMIKIIDRYLTKQKGKFLIFISSFFKIVLIIAIFYLLSKISDAAIFFFILGLSTVVLSIMIEGAYQIFRNISNGRT